MPFPSPSLYHQHISKNLEAILINEVEKKGKGIVFDAPCDVVLSEDTVYQPDILVVLKENYGKLKKTHVEGAPDIVVEILSPSTLHLDLVDKKYDYAKAGVKEYWILDPETETFEIHKNENGIFKLFSVARKKGEVFSEVLSIRISIEDVFSTLPVVE